MFIAMVILGSWMTKVAFKLSLKIREFSFCKHSFFIIDKDLFKTIKIILIKVKKNTKLKLLFLNPKPTKSFFFLPS